MRTSSDATLCSVTHMTAEQECEAERRRLEDLKHERDILIKMRSNVSSLGRQCFVCTGLLAHAENKDWLEVTSCSMQSPHPLACMPHAGTGLIDFVFGGRLQCAWADPTRRICRILSPCHHACVPRACRACWLMVVWPLVAVCMGCYPCFNQPAAHGCRRRMQLRSSQTWCVWQRTHARTSRTRSQGEMGAGAANTSDRVPCSVMLLSPWVVYEQFHLSLTLHE